MNFYRFAFATALRSEDQQVQPFRTRDGAAFNELAAGLGELGEGWKYASLIYNYPARSNPQPATEEHFRFIRPEDWIVLTTRPPMHDIDMDALKKVARSDSPLERAIFKELERFFEVCSREKIRLQKLYGKDLPKADFCFKTKVDGRLTSYGRLDPRFAREVVKGEYKTVGFFVRTRIEAYRGCGLIASFSSAGFETLLWNHVLRRRHREWLKADGLVVAELLFDADIERQPVLLDCADKIKVTRIC